MASSRLQMTRSSRSWPPQVPTQDTRRELLVNEQKYRQVSLELLESRGENRVLHLKCHQNERELAELVQERETLYQRNAALQAELDVARASIRHLQRGERRRLGSPAKQVLLLTDGRETHRSAKEGGQGRLAASRRCNATTPVSKVRWSLSLSTDGPSAASDNIESASLDLLLPELLENISVSLTVTVSQWVKGMNEWCSPEIKDGLVIPFLLQALFTLCYKFIEAKHRDLVAPFWDGLAEASTKEETRMPADTADFLYHHLSRHRHTLFPLSGASLKTAIKKITMALSLRIESEGNPKGKLSRDMHRALVESGLGKIVEDYLHIMVCCRLHQPAVAFTDDVGRVERYDSAVHSEPIDGEPATKWCVVVFPALTAPAHGEDPGGEAKVLGRRFVLAKKGR